MDFWLEVVIDVCGHGFCLKSAIVRQLIREKYGNEEEEKQIKKLPCSVN